ncbi:LptF/LptG family permease [Henriciella aquimarina]|uniref:LptF/LptG family permease n=1 Tax=Henriciella aquimarina TaxID=545261 RepID=UPI0009FF313F|nr:LptF/LptG family permease [Henriciella aquimarina]
MNRIQSYLFRQVFRSVIVIVGGLTLLAILAQGLSQTDLIVENRQSALVFFYVVALGAPQVIALLTPLAIFVATVWSMNKLHRENEIVVAGASGMTRWDIASPIIRLAVLAAIAHLAVNLWVQPTAQRTLRETVREARADLATSLVRPGQFTQAGENLTVYARESRGGDLIGVMISDNRAEARDYIAQRGRFVEVDGVPSIVMWEGQIHQIDSNGALSILDFDQSTFDLSPFIEDTDAVVLKASDRYLHELVWIDTTNYQELQDRKKFLAEAHTRLTTPLVSIAMALIAIMAVLGGDFNRRGYSRRIAYATGGALGLIMVQLTVQSISADTVAANAGQWLVPIGTILIISTIFFNWGVAPAPRRAAGATT